MISAIFWWVTSLLFSGFTFEVILYSIIDKYTKQWLNKTGNYLEKQVIWFQECAVMAVVGIIIYLHHFPSFLLFMIFLTLIFATLRGKFDIREVFESIKTYYNDSKEHEEHSPPKPLKFFTNHHPREDSLPPREDSLPPPNVTLIGAGVSNKFVLDRNDSRKPLSHHQGTRPITLNHLQNQEYSPFISTEQRTNPNDFSQSGPAFAGHFRPRGLLNENENLCFFNCVLQVLARTDGLLRELMHTTVEMRKEGRVLDEMVRVLASLTNPEPSFTKPSSIDTSDLRIILIQSFNRSSPVQVPSDQDLSGGDILERMGRWIGWGGRERGSGCILEAPSSGLQTEEDVAELFMWLMERIEAEMPCTSIRLDTEGHFYRQLQQWWHLHGRCGSGALRQMIPFYKQQFNDDPDNHETIATLAQLDWLARFLPMIESRLFGLFNLKHLFTGQLSTTTQCARCHRSTITTDIFKLLPVPLPSEESVSVEDLLARVTRHETTTACNCCTQSFRPLHSSSPKPGSTPPDLERVLSPIGRQSSGRQSPAFTRHATIINLLPPYFVVQLLRFKVEKSSPLSFTTPSNNTTKHPTAVQVSARPINLHTILRVPCTQQSFYQLYAVILHSSLYSGSINRGHYIALVRVAGEGWYSFNDNEVLPIDNIEEHLQLQEMQKNVYLLFYSKLNHSPNDVGI